MRAFARLLREEMAAADINVHQLASLSGDDPIYLIGVTRGTVRPSPAIARALLLACQSSGRTIKGALQLLEDR